MTETSIQDIVETVVPHNVVYKVFKIGEKLQHKIRQAGVDIYCICLATSADRYNYIVDLYIDSTYTDDDIKALTNSSLLTLAKLLLVNIDLAGDSKGNPVSA